MSSSYKGKQAFKKAAKVRQAGVPTFLYTSVCHSASATKTPCEADTGVKLEDRKSSLGTWLCSVCKRKAKVTVKLNKESIDPFAKPAMGSLAVA